MRSLVFISHFSLIIVDCAFLNCPFLVPSQLTTLRKLYVKIHEARRGLWRDVAEIMLATETREGSCGEPGREKHEAAWALSL
jgi:hypothetical protein